ncbi:MAG: CHRD domain-containing protein [Actinomycetota bacterium]|nr:CHRD domain-containing protein [Actinomycetota bacterium]
MKKSLLFVLAPAAALCVVAVAAPAHADSGTSYQATLAAVNGSGASGTFTLSLNGNTATISEHVSGLAATFSGAAYPHVQHIHGGAKGVCPTVSADTSKDGVISTTEGAPSYGGILTTLSTSGDTSPAAGTNIKAAPSGASYDYSRTITVDSKTVASLKAGTAVIVVHGLNPTTLSAAAQAEKSDLVPSLPLAATSPTLCGKVLVSQMTGMPQGSVATGGGSTSGLQNEGLLAAGGAMLLGAGALMGARRRLTSQR